MGSIPPRSVVERVNVLMIGPLRTMTVPCACLQNYCLRQLLIVRQLFISYWLSTVHISALGDVQRQRNLHVFSWSIKARIRTNITLHYTNTSRLNVIWKIDVHGQWF